jgi:formate dehydrogenase iron-sulfur subunit
MKAGLLFDSTACIGCEACAAACKEKNDLPGPVEKKLTAYTWTTVEHRAGIHVRRLCFHCEAPTCASVCPVGAFRKDPQGPVVYDAGRCIGCRYCVMACPFDVPKYQWDRAIPIVQKCSMCADRVVSGQEPVCASVCPTGATVFGDRDQLVREARARLAGFPKRYLPRIYGLDEVGGTSVLMLSSVPLAKAPPDRSSGAHSDVNLACLIPNSRPRSGRRSPAVRDLLDNQSPRARSGTLGPGVEATH